MTYLTQEVFNSTNSFPWCFVFHHESWRPTSRPEFVICFQERWEVETPCDQRDDDEKGEERSLGKWERSFNIDWECFRTNDLAAPESLDSHCVHKTVGVSCLYIDLSYAFDSVVLSDERRSMKNKRRTKGSEKRIREENQSEVVWEQEWRMTILICLSFVAQNETINSCCICCTRSRTLHVSETNIMMKQGVVSLLS